jgi:hypothetical protein
MTVKEYAERLSELYGVVGDITDYTILPAGAEMLREIKRRVTKSGTGTDGNAIGNYSTKPIYVEKEMFIKKGAFKAQGKNGNIGDRLIPTARTKTNSTTKNPVRYTEYTIAKPNYKPRKTMYLPNGYKELREIQSLQVSYIDLKYSGRMVRDYQLQKQAQTVLLGITTRRSADIYVGLTVRFGEFYQPSQSEIDTYKKRVSFSLNRLVRDTIQGVSVNPSIEIYNPEII